MTELLTNRVNGLVSFPDLVLVDTPVSVVGIEFQVVTGGEVNIVDSVRDRGVGDRFDHEIPNLPTVTDFTLSRTWNEERDGQLAAALKNYVGSIYANVSKIRRDLNLNKAGADRFTRCLLKGVTTPDGDTADNGTKTMLTLTLSGGIPG